MNRSINWKLGVNFTGFLIILSLFTIICSTEDIEVIGAPIIIPPVAEVILNKGQNFTISCRSNNPIQIKQQEIPEENSVNYFRKVLKNATTTDPNYKFQIAFDLYNVDEFAVGYYACYDDTINGNDILVNVMTEPTNSDHVSYIYVYVNGTDSLLAPMREIIRLRNESNVVIECRPTTPDVVVTLLGDFPDSEYHQSFNPKIGFTFESDYLEAPLAIITCSFERQGIYEQKYIFFNKHQNETPPKPKITIDTPYFLEGETFTLNCTVNYQLNSALVLLWERPTNSSWNRVLNYTNDNDTTNSIVYKAITIVNATKEDDGIYTCICRNYYNRRSNATERKKYMGDKGFIKLTSPQSQGIIEVKQSYTKLRTRIDDHPAAKINFYKNNELLGNNSNKYVKNYKPHELFDFRIINVNINDTGNYTLVASNKYVEKNITFDVRIEASPTVNIVPSDDIKCQLGLNISITCEAIGYPLPGLKWIFVDNGGKHHTIMAKNRVLSLIKVESKLEIPLNASGKITCYAENRRGTSNSTRKVIMYEVPQGFGLKNGVSEKWYPVGHDVNLECYASKEDFQNVTWLRYNNETNFNEVRTSENRLSYIAHLEMKKVELDDAGLYKCVGLRKDNLTEQVTITITVADRREVHITDLMTNSDKEVNPYEPVRLSCQAAAVPPPTIIWYKDGKELYNSSDINIITEYIDTHQTIVNSSVDIQKMLEEYSGQYECVAISQEQKMKKAYGVVIADKLNKTKYWSITGAVVFVLILLIVYMAWKIRKEKKFRKQLAAAGLLYFKKGVPKSLNPDLGIDEQAELLPYDDKFEFPPHKLIIGKQLGAGAFGVVYKAEARGIINAEEVTPVAVKMVKKTADNMYIRALASELKIMVHLGKHINIVNLLGACTKNVGKRELLVIVEYCKFGNIHNYMQRHREVFINQLTDNKEKNSGKVNRGFSCSSGSSGLQSDLGSNHTQETENTFVNTVNTQYARRSGRKVSETGYIQPEWRSNYESDYSFDGRNPRPLTSRDLLAWAFQIARGMEYLASRKVLHGDLAARNVLLAEDNIVKICDFGLARSIYKNDEYKKQENSPLPIKWLAIECMTDRIFSTQSDVWSFGVVLWELFSLAKTPYPNVSPASFIDWLNDGLEKPKYADDRLYDVMLRCWEQKPTARPNFSQLQEILGSFLEDNVRNHYVDLNAVYMDSYGKQESGNDYLAMVCAPDYNNLVTPSPHHYANDATSFFPLTPTQLQHDDEGYLQMSPATKQTLFNSRASGNKFDFDARKMNTKIMEPNSQGSELTPMLTLNNLPSRGSESDHDGNSLPYLNMCPRIEEETDDVFEMKQYDFDNAQNSENSAVTNPSYIKFDGEKKPYNISNNYINVNIPNGLVK